MSDSGRQLIEKLSLNFIIQRDNFNEIEDFCHFAESVGADSVWFQQITNWGTYSDEEFNSVNVFDKKKRKLSIGNTEPKICLTEKMGL